MIIPAFLLSLHQHQPGVQGPTLQYYQGAFEIREGSGTKKVVQPETASTKDPVFVAFRRNDAFAVWDKRGLTLRHGKVVSSSRLNDVATSPKVFSKEEILKTASRISKEEVTREAAALSGARRLGKKVYFLVRWEDSDSKPWAEVLIEVDLTAAKLKPQLLGRFEGLSTATKAVDDKLLIIQGKLAIVSRKANSWAVSSYDPASKAFETVPVGGKLKSFQPMNLTQALFIETSSYGTSIAGRVDLEKGTRKILYEGREQIELLDASPPEIILATEGNKTKLVNSVSGAVRTIPFPLAGRRVGGEVLVWTPPTTPTAAWLMNPTSWQTLATWRGH